jgi:hypothetical protein
VCVCVCVCAAPGGFNDTSRKTCKNLEAAIVASKRPGYFAYYEAPEHVKAVERSGEVQRLQEQVAHLQKQIDVLTDKMDAGRADDGKGSASPSVGSLKQWLATYGSPTQAHADQFTSFTPGRKVYGGTALHSAFRSQASTMKKGRLTK